MYQQDFIISFYEKSVKYSNLSQLRFVYTSVAVSLSEIKKLLNNVHNDRNEKITGIFQIYFLRLIKINKH